jgi:Zn-dependent M16 (insulinase) family peptidase
VDATQLSTVEARFVELLNEVASRELDMTYMKACLDRERRQQMFSAETSDQWFTSAIIATFLFSKDRSLEDLTTLTEFTELSKWNENQWRGFLKKWISDAPRITILGKPSAALSKKMKEEEEARVVEQKKRLGEKGLKELEEKLKRAREENDKPIPKRILEEFKVPSTDTIHFVSTTPARSGRARELGSFDNPIQAIIDREKSDLPLYIHYEHVPSNFIHINVLLGTAAIPLELRPLLPVYLENFFNTPIVRDGERIEFEDVVKELERTTVGYGISSAAKLGNTEIINLAFQVETDKYDEAIRWIKDLFWNSVFDLERVLSTTVRLLQDVPDEKRSGTDMTYAVALMIQEKPESITRASSTLVKALYLKRLKKLLQSDPEKMLSQFEQVREALCQMSNIRVLVTADIEKLKSPVESWRSFTKDHSFDKPLAELDNRIDRLTSIGRSPANISYILPMATIDSSYVLSVTKGLDSPKDPELPALMVAISYLDAVEGPLWTSVRGAGLAYGTGFRRRLGQIEYSVYRSPDSYKAFSASKKVLEDFISGERQLDNLAMEGAVSSIVLTIANSQATIIDAAADNIIMQVIREVPRDWNDVLLEKVRAVTKEQVIASMKKLLLPAFLPQSSNLFVTCATVMEEVSSYNIIQSHLLTHCPRIL